MLMVFIESGIHIHTYRLDMFANIAALLNRFVAFSSICKKYYFSRVELINAAGDAQLPHALLQSPWRPGSHALILFEINHKLVI